MYIDFLLLTILKCHGILQDFEHNYADLGNVLQVTRLKREITMQQMAELIGLSLSTYFR